MSEARQRAVVDTVGVILIDPHGAVLMANPACERLFGYAANEIVGRNVIGRRKDGATFPTFSFAIKQITEEPQHA